MDDETVVQQSVPPAMKEWYTRLSRSAMKEAAEKKQLTEAIKSAYRQQTRALRRLPTSFLSRENAAMLSMSILSSNLKA